MTVVRPEAAAALFAVVGMLVVCADARAQVPEAPPEDPRQAARIRWSPVYLTPSFRVSELAVDSNVFNSATNPRADLTMTLTPAVDAWVPIQRRVVFSTRAAADLVWFKSFASERSINPELAARVDVRGTRVNVWASSGWQRSRQRPSFEIDARSRRSTTHQHLGVAWRIRPKLEAELIGSIDVIDFDQQEDVITGTNLRTALNRTERAVDARLYYALTPMTTVYVRGQLHDDRFSRAPSRDGQGGRAAIGVRFNRRALVAGSAEIGFRRLFTLRPDLPDFSGLVGSAALSHTTGGTRIGLSWSRDLEYSAQQLRPYYIDTGVGVSVRRQLFGNFDMLVGARRDRYEYRTFDALLTPMPGRVRRFEYGIDVGYRFRPDLRIGLGMTNWRRTWQFETDRAVRGTQWGVSVSYGVL